MSCLSEPELERIGFIYLLSGLGIGAVVGLPLTSYLYIRESGGKNRWRVKQAYGVLFYVIAGLGMIIGYLLAPSC